MENDTSLSKFISLVLRHNPSAIGIELDNHGWANVDELISGLKAHGESINMQRLEKIVAEDSKQRYSFNEDKTKIRANQGHSIPVDVELKEFMPPEILYHGTADRFMDSINEKGLIKKDRNYVHLSFDKETAIKVGARHGRPVILEIAAGQMFRDGHKFYLSDNNVPLTDSVFSKYIKEIE